MSKTIKQNRELVKQLKSKGWVMQGDKLVRPTSDVKQTKKVKVKRTYDIHDAVNIRNNEQQHPFKTYLKSELECDVWIEFEFSSERKFRIDYALPIHKIAIEIDGGIWMRGRSGHSSGTGIKRDQEKTTLLSVCGWSVIRITPDEQYNQKLISDIKKIMARNKS